MKVKANKDVIVPFENPLLGNITEHDVVDVENTTYYQRRIIDGDLIIVNEQKNKKGAKQ
ncbi:DUF2635 domain-containing protein [Mergibacter septicus]|uniref:DUF2635 domain-containing protein n=1 Tax=Mergibacter septicus TaxID=221402 RepID=UPI001178D89D|nr:DUF2635 domain-containing protein [Mergibacter septicus]AWX14272.1 DUF2635 domain-containing protein [Mergibacter septicus]